MRICYVSTPFLVWRMFPPDKYLTSYAEDACALTSARVHVEWSLSLPHVCFSEIWGSQIFFFCTTAHFEVSLNVLEFYTYTKWRIRNENARSQVFAAGELNSSVLWVITRHKVVWNRSFGTAYRSHFYTPRNNTKEGRIEAEVILLGLLRGWECEWKETVR